MRTPRYAALARQNPAWRGAVSLWRARNVIFRLHTREKPGHLL